MMDTKKKRRFKIETYYEEDMGQRSIRVLDRAKGFTFVFYEDEVEGITNRDLHPLRRHLRKRMHLIQHGAYDTKYTDE